MNSAGHALDLDEREKANAEAIASRLMPGWPLLRTLALYRLTPWRFWITLALYVVLNLGLVWQQALLGAAVDAVHGGRAVMRLSDGSLDLRPMLWWVAILGGVALARAVLQYAAAIYGLLIQQQMLTTLREAIFRQVQALHMGYHWRRGTGEVITLTTHDADKVRNSLTSFWRQGVDSVLAISAAMGFLFWYEPSLGWVPLVLTLVALLLLLRQADGLVVLDRAVGQAYEKVNQDLSEGIHGVRVIKAFGLEENRVRSFAQQVGQFVALAEAALRFAAWRVPVPQMLVGFGQVWVLGYGIWLVAQGSLHVGQLLAALLMVNTLVFRIEGVGRVIKIYADARASAGRIWDFLDTRSDLRSGTRIAPSTSFGIRLRQVAYAQRLTGHEVLVDISFTLLPGELVALVGATGSGKSTLASLMPRFVDPQRGVVEIGMPGQWSDAREFDLGSMRRRIQVVTQDSFLFADTLAENLRLSAPEADDDALCAGLALAAADDFVRAMPDGLQARIGDRGVDLSGGQRQRLCLARALLADPAVLVLDDATSALDALTERTVLSRIRAHGACGGQAPAILLVTNRRATLEMVDRVLLLQDGRIAADGSNAELERGSQAYRTLMGVDFER